MNKEIFEQAVEELAVAINKSKEESKELIESAVKAFKNKKRR